MNEMAVEDKEQLKSQTLTIRLLKKNISIQNALNTEHDYTLQDTSNGTLYTIQSDSKSPSWSGFLEEYTGSKLSNLKNQHCSAILFVTTSPASDPEDIRTLALTFGYGHNALEMSSFERNFGLKVTLSAVTRGELISLDTATLDSTIFQRRIQASKKANFSGFGVNIHTDLLRLAGGVPSDTTFASLLAGKDALMITSKTSPENFLNKCAKALELYYSNDYKKEFSFIDHITPITNLEHNIYLDSYIFRQIRKLVSGKRSDLHLITPDVTNPESMNEISYYGAGFSRGTKTSYPNLNINDYISEIHKGDFSSIDSFDLIKGQQYVYEVHDGVRNKKGKRKIYDCFVYEIEISVPVRSVRKVANVPSSNIGKMPQDFIGGVYVLFSGSWYLVDKGFHAEVEKSYLKYLSNAPFIISTKSKNEKELIDELNIDPNLLNLDQVKINPAGVTYANIEPCDFLSMNRQFIHLKDGESSGPISHLWNQGAVSAVAYLDDLKFRVDLNKSILERQKKYNKTGFNSVLKRANAKVETSTITVVFGVMRTPFVKNKKAGLPFFSKVSFRPIAQNIERMGYRVELHLIEKI